MALRRITDRVWSEVARRGREESVAGEVWAEWAFAPPADVEVGVEVGVEEDETLVLLSMCCHPALTSASAVSLTLRAEVGLTTTEITSAFLVPEGTMAQRISWARRTIRASGVPLGGAVRARLHEMNRDERRTAARYLPAAGSAASVPERYYLMAREARLVGRGRGPAPRRGTVRE